MQPLPPPALLELPGYAWSMPPPSPRSAAPAASRLTAVMLLEDMNFPTSQGFQLGIL